MAEEKSGVQIGSTLKHVGSLQEVQTGNMSYCDLSADQWNIRSESFLSNKVKKPSEQGLLKLHAVDLFKSKNKVPRIMERLSLPSGLPEIARDPHDGGFYVPKLIVVNFMLPLYSHSMLFTKEDGESVQFVMYYSIDQAAYDNMVNSDSNAWRVLKEWLQVDPTSEEDYQNRGRLKAIPEILNVNDIRLGALRPVVLANSAKPFLTGPRYHSYVKADDYLEIDVDIHRYAYVARNTLSGMLSEIPKMVVKFGMVVEGRSNDELPEQLLGGIVLKVDQTKAVSL